MTGTTTENDEGEINSREKYVERKTRVA